MSRSRSMRGGADRRRWAAQPAARVVVEAPQVDVRSGPALLPWTREIDPSRTHVRLLGWTQMPAEQLVVHGAREHNLKDVTVSLPRYSLICITGLSGSGKSSLAFDTIYAEGQRRY